MENEANEWNAKKDEEIRQADIAAEAFRQKVLEKKNKQEKEAKKTALYDVNYKNSNKIIQFHADDLYYDILGKCFNAHILFTRWIYCDPEKWKVVIHRGPFGFESEVDLEQYITSNTVHDEPTIGRTKFWTHNGGGGYSPIFFLREKNNEDEEVSEAYREIHAKREKFDMPNPNPGKNNVYLSEVDLRSEIDELKKRLKNLENDFDRVK